MDSFSLISLSFFSIANEAFNTAMSSLEELEKKLKEVTDKRGMSLKKYFSQEENEKRKISYEKVFIHPYICYFDSIILFLQRKARHYL